MNLHKLIQNKSKAKLFKFLSKQFPCKRFSVKPVILMMKHQVNKVSQIKKKVYLEMLEEVEQR